MGKKIAIIQSSYIPWKGYFDIINKVDEFVLFDDVQFTRRDWRNRNLIKTPKGRKWLTIPVFTKNNYTEKIKNIKVVSPSWAKNHWKTLVQYYQKAPHFYAFADLIKSLYENAEKEVFLSRINYIFIKNINDILGIKTNLVWSSDIMGNKKIKDKTEKLIYICKKMNAYTYISGPSANNYMDESLFAQQNIKVEWMDYSNYPEYPQLYSPFDHRVSIVDTIFNTGKDARKYIKSF
jgi:glutaredoxin-related protein